MERTSIVARFDGDEELVGELVSLFITECPRLLDEVRAAAGAGQPERLSRAAHAFKGMAANFTDGGVVKVAQTLELTAREGRLEGVPALLSQLDRELAGLLDVLRPFTEVQPCES